MFFESHHVAIFWTKHWFKLCFSPLTHYLDMVCCQPSIRLEKPILVVNNIALETLSSDAVLSTQRVAVNFCSQPDQPYGWTHQSSDIPTSNWKRKAFLGSRIITPENPLLRYDCPRLYFLPEDKFLSVSATCSGPTIWTTLFMKCETVIPLQHWF